jgi:hypothetical protein
MSQRGIKRDYIRTGVSDSKMPLYTSRRKALTSAVRTHAEVQRRKSVTRNRRIPADKTLRTVKTLYF